MRLVPALLAAVAVPCMTCAAMAQFPPPGIYRCVTLAGAPLGTLSLFAAGDYQFSVAADASFAEKAGDSGNGKGQLTSASTSITIQSGPLLTVYQFHGSFHTDPAKRRTTFAFTGPGGSGATCAVKG